MILTMLKWFPKNVNLTTYLTRWRDVPISFDADQPINSSWYVDMGEHPLGHDADDPALFDRAVEQLLRYAFYPEDILIHVSDASLEDRRLRQGDRIVQQLRGVGGLVDAVTMNVVSAMMVEPNRMGFTYRTTFEHLEIGEMTFAILRKRTGQVVLALQGMSKPSPKMPFYVVPRARKLQKRAHQRGVEHFRGSVQFTEE